MRTIYKIAAAVMGSILLLSSCGDAGAKTKKTEVNQNKKTGKVMELNADTFNSLVYDMTKEDVRYLGSAPAIVDFTASWCGPCQRITPILEELAGEYEGEIVIYKVDIDKERDLAMAFGVSSIPAILYIPLNGEPVMTVGSRGKEKFKTEISRLLLPVKED